MTLLNLNNRLAKKFDTRPMFTDFLNEIYGDILTPETKLNTIPGVNITEENDKFTVALAAPGLSKEDFKISIEKEVLTISAEKKEETSEVKPHYSRKEFSYTNFKRSFNLPETVNTEDVKASYENGVLALNIPKKSEAKQKPVFEVKVS
ncbi:MAG: Hsp20/alpha crystallin family protein [Bacteroidia bacterium]